MTESNFANQLVKARAVAGLTQAALSSKAGISMAQISRYETGMAHPRAYVKHRLAMALGVQDFDAALVSWEAVHDLSKLSTSALIAELGRRVQ